MPKKAAVKKDTSKKKPLKKKAIKKTTKKKVAKGASAIQEVNVVDNAAATPKTRKIVPIQCVFARERVLTEQNVAAVELNRQGAYGTLLDDGKVQLTLTEALYLLGKKRIVVYDGRNNLMDSDSFIRKASKTEPHFWTRFAVYKDMRERGYVVKTALKFGADFRVYDRGIKPGEDHARWIVYPVHEGEKYTWFDFAAKNRVAHSTKKRLMMGVVDDENDVTYWEIRWVRP